MLVVSTAVALFLAAPPPDCCPILELRQYTLHPGQRDVLVELFDREFVETQEAFGMRIVGQFRDLDRPDRFVWLRGFPSMEDRARALAGFYGGPVWKAKSKAANATMIDATNVLLLHPSAPGSGFALDALEQPNTFPALPVREGEHVFVFFSRYEDAAAYERHLAALARSKSWSAASQALSSRLSRPPETLRLAATARSRLGALRP